MAYRGFLAFVLVEVLEVAAIKQAFGRLRNLVAGGSEEFHRDDLLRRTEAGIFALRSFGVAGAELFPAAVDVIVQVASASDEVVRQVVQDPAFDAEVEARLRNRLNDPGRTELPSRRYRVEPGEEDDLKVETDQRTAVAALRVEGGDRDGQRLPLSTGQRLFRIGRGAWHGGGRQQANDIVVCETQAFVSRAAASLKRVGSLFEVSPRDQGDCLVVVRADGARLRPSMTALGKTRLQLGDGLEFNDGAEQAILLWLEDECGP